MLDTIFMDFAISIHALRGEGDDGTHRLTFERNKFLSTPSVGRATMMSLLKNKETEISIHALRGEGDPRRPR